MKVCLDNLWNVTELWKFATPKVSNCLQLTLLCVPCVIVWTLSFGCLMCHILLSNKHYPPLTRTPINIWFLIKVLIHIVAAVLPLIDLMDSGLTANKTGITVYPIYYIYAAVLSVSVLLCLFLMYIKRRIMRPSCLIQFCFWLSFVICGLPRLYQLIADSVLEGQMREANKLWIFATLYLLSVFQIILQSFSGYKAENSMLCQANPCPEIHASVMSKLMFSWLDNIVYRAYKTELKEEDIFNLREEESVQKNLSIFTRVWDAEIRRTERKKQIIQSQTPSRAVQVTENSPFVNMDELETGSHDIPNQENDVRVIDGKKREKSDVLKPSLFVVLVKVFGPALLISWIFKFVYDVFSFANPFLLRFLLEYVKDPSQPDWHGGLYAVAYLAVAVISSVFFHKNFFMSYNISLRIRSALIAAVYKKALTLTIESRAESTIGEIVNLMSVDAERICDIVADLWFTWSTVLQIGIALGLLYRELGPSIFAGVAVLVILMPINLVAMSKLQTYETKEMEWKDERIKLLSEILNGIKILKLYAWEPSYQRKISKIRGTELSYTLKNGIGWSVVLVIWDIAPYLVMLATFLTYVYSANDHFLDPEKAFVSLALFNMVRFPMVILPWGISSCINAAVSVKRIRNFLMSNDIDLNGIYKSDTPPEDGEPAIKVTNGTFSWKNDGKPVLNEIELEIPKGRLVAVVGKVGVGKSSLISAILGEMHRLDGRVTVKGRVAYASQEAWIQNLSLRDNILFGCEMDTKWYEKVIEACALKSDLKLLPGSDETEIGERGINLSGGQKQRVSLARAVYQNADIYFLDDPLSAVDAHVGRHIFDEVIGPEGLLSSKTRVLVTHGVHWLPGVDEVFVLDKQGRVAERGTYQELLDSERDFADFIRAVLQDPKAMGEEDIAGETDLIDDDVGVFEAEMSPGRESPSSHVRAAELLQRLQSRTSDRLTPPISPVHPDILCSSLENKGFISGDEAGQSRPRRLSRLLSAGSAIEEPSRIRHRNRNASQSSQTSESRHAVPTEQQGHRLTEDESMEAGQVSWRAYATYVVARGITLSIVVIVFYGLFSACQIGSNVWLQRFTEDPLLVNASKRAAVGDNASLIEERKLVDYYLGIYGLFGVAELIFVTAFALVQTFANIRASKIIHKDLLSRILRAPMSFFDTTPTGRIVNRFSKDMESIDHELPGIVSDFISCAFVVLSSVIVISYSTPPFLIVMVPVIAIYILIQYFYIPISRQSRRLDSVTRSPIFNNFSETIQGAPVIRAFGQQQRFASLSDERIDHNARFFFVKTSSNRWLGLRLEILGGFVVFAAVLFAVLGRSSISAGIVGLSITYALQVTDNLNWLVRMLTELETSAVSLERLKEYSAVQQEAAWDIPHSRPEAEWPFQGQVHFNGYSTRYRPGLPLVLDNVEVMVKPGERIGIVGRTGAGKSSLTLALFRLVEATSGNIVVDGVRLGDLGLHQLRSRLTILPQDPVLFSGTLRENVDPFMECDDTALWHALDQAHLGDWVHSQPEGLDYACGEGGGNLSVGQKQLVCLARALLRRSKLLVLDEATAAVDLDTDKLIMSTIREKFTQSTIMIIAHRLPTILDADKVMVLDKGRIKEYAPPHELLADPDSYFYGLAKDAGLV